MGGLLRRGCAGTEARRELVRAVADLAAGGVEARAAEAERRRRDVERRHDPPAEVADRGGDGGVAVLELAVDRGVAESAGGRDALGERADVARGIAAGGGQLAVA